VDANSPFNFFFNFLIGALASTKVDANDGISASTLTVDANNPLILLFF
jgi:hypothetical protein